MFCLEGWDREFSTVKELTDSLKTFVLKSGSDSFTVKKCCLPRQGGLSSLMPPTPPQCVVWMVCCVVGYLSLYMCVLCNAEPSNLLVKRQGVNNQVQTDSFSLNLTQLRFHQIKDKEITQVTTCHLHMTFCFTSAALCSLLCDWPGECCIYQKQEQHLGRGTRTNIYSGRLMVRGGGGHDEDDEFNNNNLADRKGIRVVLKILDQTHKDIALVSKTAHWRRITTVGHWLQADINISFNILSHVLGIFWNRKSHEPSIPPSPGVCTRRISERIWK